GKRHLIGGFSSGCGRLQRDDRDVSREPVAKAEVAGLLLQSSGHGATGSREGSPRFFIEAFVLEQCRGIRSRYGDAGPAVAPVRRSGKRLTAGWPANDAPEVGPVACFGPEPVPFIFEGRERRISIALVVGGSPEGEEGVGDAGGAVAEPGQVGLAR